MKCPNCGKEECKYIEQRKRRTEGSKEPIPRTDFHAKCRKCGWVGTI